jgi:hypothetical protein
MVAMLPSGKLSCGLVIDPLNNAERKVAKLASNAEFQ